MPIWLDFIKLSTDHLTEKDLLVPEGLSIVRVDEQSGEVSNTFDNSFFEYFLEENLLSLLDEENSDYQNIFN